MGVADDVKAWCVKAESELAAKVVEVLTDIFCRIVQRTPVSTGRARASWRLALGEPDWSTEPPGNYDAGHALAQLAKLQELSLKQLAAAPIFITNSVPYIRPLEYGHSKQAPNGMVRLTVAEFDGKGYKVTVNA